MKRSILTIFMVLTLCPTLLRAQKDLQSTPELRKFIQQGWKVQHANTCFDSLTIFFSAVAPGSTHHDLYVTRSQSGSWSTPERLGPNVNSDADELWPSIASDKRRLYFIRRAVDAKLLKSSHGAQGVTERLYVTEYLHGEWQKAEPIVISSDHDLSPLVLPDNKTMLFARREMEKKRPYYALYHTRYLGYGVWALPVRIDPEDRHSVYGPYLRQLGDTVLQLTEMQLTERDRQTTDTLYTNSRMHMPEWTRPEPYGMLRGKVTDENSGRPVEATIRLYDAITAIQLDEVLADASTGLFRIALHSGIHYNIDITAPDYSHYYTTLDCYTTDSLYTRYIDVQIARNLQVRINTFDADLFSPAPPDREVIRNTATDKPLRVRTKRDERGREYELPIGETYALTLYTRGYIDTTIILNTRRDVRFSKAELDLPMRPVKVPLLLSLNEDEMGAVKEGTIRLRNRNKHEVIEMPYTPPTTTVMIRQEDEYELVIQSPGHFFFDTIVSIPDGYDKQLCNVTLDPIKKDMVVQLRNINFESNSYVLTRSSFVELEKVVALMQSNPELKIELSAHTDDVGTDAYNDALSAKRGEATVAYLVRKGINPERLTSIGYGKRKPLVPNDSDENRAINRRVEFKVTDF